MVARFIVTLAALLGRMAMMTLRWLISRTLFCPDVRLPG
jgi:hypothetical protein